MRSLETFLAELYTDPARRRRFLDNPRREAEAAGLLPADIEAVAVRVDRTGLLLAGRSFDRKRSLKTAHRAAHQVPWWRRWSRW